MTSEEARALSTLVSAPLAVLHTITEAQVRRLQVLTNGFKPERIVLTRDSWQESSVLFALYEHKDGSDRIIINGLIESDGRAHT